MNLWQALAVVALIGAIVCVILAVAYSALGYAILAFLLLALAYVAKGGLRV